MTRLTTISSGINYIIVLIKRKVQVRGAYTLYGPRDLPLVILPTRSHPGALLVISLVVSIVKYIMYCSETILRHVLVI